MDRICRCVQHLTVDRLPGAAVPSSHSIGLGLVRWKGKISAKIPTIPLIYSRKRGASCTQYLTSMKWWLWPRNWESTWVPDEAVMYRKYLMEKMGQLDTFVQARLEESKPPMVSAAREPGFRPSPEEDPLNAWIWRCRIEGAAEGLLAGKTVSFKDHIAVAGIPMSFGSFALEGFIPDFDRNRRHPGAEGGRHHHWQERHERTEWRLRYWRRLRRLRPAPQPTQPRSCDRGIIRGFRRGRGRPRGGHLFWRRPGRLHPYPLRLSPALSDTSPHSDCCPISGSGSGLTRASTTRVQ